jgi:hypothetical protein
MAGRNYQRKNEIRVGLWALLLPPLQWVEIEIEGWSKVEKEVEMVGGEGEEKMQMLVRGILKAKEIEEISIMRRKMMTTIMMTMKRKKWGIKEVENEVEMDAG